MSRSAIIALAAVVVASVVSAQTPSAARREADIYLVSPGAGYTRYYDPLMAETAVRLTGISLEARHGLRVAESDFGTEVDDAARQFPRVELRPSGWPEMQTLRLQRTGETFVCSAAGSDGRFLEIGRVRRQMPRRAYVGAMVFSYYDGNTVGAIVEDIRLNGEPLTDSDVAMLGSPAEKFDAYWSEDRLHLRSIGHWTAADRRPQGPFAHARVEGDFTIEARLHTFTHVPKWRYWGLACYADLRDDAEVVGVYSDGSGLYGGIQPAGAERLMWVWDGERHFVRAYMLDGKREPAEITRTWASPASWEQLIEGVAELSGSIERATGELDAMRGGVALGAAPATDDQLAALNRARQLALRFRGDEILSAVEWVRDVLEESPTCPEAHYTAAYCGAMLAMREPRGAFHQRGRLLARPMAHLLFARKLSEPTRPQDHLAEAWVMLSAGYPDAALRAAEGVDDSFAPAELRALRMFATRDTRGLDVDRLGGVTPLERAAWTRAVEKTAPHMLHGRLAELARRDGSPAALPVFAVADAEQEAFCRAGLGLSAARTVADLLKSEDMPRRDRLASAERITGALNIHMTGDLGETANLIAAVLAQDGLDDRAAAEVTAAALELCDSAERARAYPWHLGVVTPGDYAAYQRGLLLTWLYRRAELLARNEQTRLAGRDYCNALAEALHEVTGAAEYFCGLAAAAGGEVYRTRASLRRVFDSPFGSNIPALYFIAADWGGNFDRRILDDSPYRFGRGSWDLSLHAALLGITGGESRRFAVQSQQLRIDSHAADAGTTAVAEVSPFSK